MKSVQTKFIFSLYNSLEENTWTYLVSMRKKNKCYITTWFNRQGALSAVGYFRTRGYRSYITKLSRYVD